MSNLYKFLLLCSAVLSIFYPTIFAEVNLLDDVEMLKNLANINDFSVSGIFFPHGHGGMYYRPLIHLSFLADRFIWNLDPAIMHFENILLHLANSILVMFIAIEILRENENAKKWFPLIAAFLFAFHPITTESVNWISGRTDLLSTFFVLCSCYLIFRSHNRRNNVKTEKNVKIYYILCAMFFLCLGVLAKEPAVGFIPGMVFILFGKSEGLSLMLPPGKNRIIVFVFAILLALSTALIFYSYLAVVAIAVCYGLFLVTTGREDINTNCSYKQYIPAIIVSLVAIIAVFWGVRKVVFASQSSHIARTFKLLFADVNYTISVFLKAYGFYVKKFFLPLPLSFVIREVNIFYSLLGVIVLCVVMVMITRRNTADTLVLAGLCMLAPVLPLTFDSIAWTSYAERYLYPAAPFWILSISAYFSPLSGRISVANCRFIAIVLVVLLILMSYVTFNRNLIWRTNVAIFMDSVEKTPSYKQLRGLYMTALYEKGEYEEAVRQYKIAESLPVIKFKDDSFSLFYARLLICQRKYDEAEQVLKKALKEIRSPDPEIYELLIALESSRMEKVKTSERKAAAFKSMIHCQEKWYALTKNPIHLYQLGQLYLLVNDRKAAQVSFDKASKTAPATSHYHEAAKKLAERLDK